MLRDRVAALYEADEVPAFANDSVPYADLPSDELDKRLEKSLADDSAFGGRRVSRQHSVVKLASSAPSVAAAVQRDISVTEALDSLFAENLANDTTLKWQYFGSANGVLRTFPGRRWTARIG